MSAQGVLVQFVSDADQVVPADVALCLFRIAQEALTNVVKHSGASTARVALSAATNLVVLRVEDAGCGFVSDGPADGLGLISIRERARSVGGDVIIQSAPGQGTAIETRVPVSGLSALPAPAESADTSSLRDAECPPLLLFSDRSESSLG
jgi:signal transduction histidine kinase